MSRRLKEKADTLISGERGTIFKDPGGRLNICLIYPNTYHVGMSSLAVRALYSILNSRHDVLCERAFLPDTADLEEFGRTKTELFSLESKRPLRRFDVLAFSISFENDYPNILKILDLARIHFMSAQRNDSHPLLLAGGVCAFSNPEPIADFFDLIAIGEAEPMIDGLVDMLKKNISKKDKLLEAMTLPGVYVPEFYKVSYNEDGTIKSRISKNGAPDVIRRQFAPDISGHSGCQSIIAVETEFREMHLVEAMRGCPWACNFCLAGHIYNPPRQKPLESIKAEIVSAGGIGRVGLVGPSLSDYRHIEEVLKMEGVDFSITSLRAMPKSSEVVKLMKGKKSVSIAPEAGTERLRHVINKKVTETDIIETSRQLLTMGIERLKLYFMVGLPTETDADIDGIIELVKTIRGLSNRGEISLTLSTFVPKPFTPFEWRGMARPDIVKSRMSRIKKSLLPIKGIRVFHDVPKQAYLQGFLSMSDRRASSVIIDVHVGKDPMKAIESYAEFVVFRDKPFDEILPWDFIDNGLDKRKLQRSCEDGIGQAR